MCEGSQDHPVAGVTHGFLAVISTEFCCSRLLLPLEGDGSGQRHQEKPVENSEASRKSGFPWFEENPFFTPRNLQVSLLYLVRTVLMSVGYVVVLYD